MKLIKVNGKPKGMNFKYWREKSNTKKKLVLSDTSTFSTLEGKNTFDY